MGWISRKDDEIVRLNLGCADRAIPGFTGVDLPGSGAEQEVDLTGPWPWGDSSVEEILALDVCEHIVDHSPAFSSRVASGHIHFMNELHRVLVPGGRATIETPNAAKGCGYFQDPTHVSPWCLSTFKYFEHGAFARERLGALYGITARFKVISLDEFETNGEDPREKAWKIKAVLEAVK